MKVEKIKIAGYEVEAIEFDSGNFGIHFPYGDTEEDKKMFDWIVYNNKGSYTGTVKNKNKVIDRVRILIIDYKTI